LNPTTLAVQSFQNVRTGFSVSVAVTSSDPTIGSIVTSPIAFTADTDTAPVKFHPLTAGSTSLAITAPVGFSTPTGGNATSIAANVTAPTLSLNVAANIGQNLQVDNQSVSLGAAPPNSETLTLTSSSANVLLANSPAGPFSQSISLSLTKGSFSVPVFSVEGLSSIGSAQLTAQAPGYTDGVSVINLTPSGIVWGTGNFNTTSFSPDATLTLFVAQLNPNNLNFQSFQNLRTGLSVNVVVTSSDTTVGTITNQASFSGDTSSSSASFHAIAAGTTNLLISTPSGFTTPNSSAISIAATVSAPNLSINASTNLGQNLQVDDQSVGLAAPPPVNETLIITSNSPALLLSATPNGTFADSVSLQLTKGSFAVPTFSMQSLGNSGTFQLTASAPGYNNATLKVTLTPSGIAWNTGNFSTTTSSANSTVSIIVGQLNPSTLTFQAVQNIRSGLSVSVTITSSDTTIGTIVTSPVTITSDTLSTSAIFHPLAVGTTNLVLSTPAGFATPNPPSATSIVVNVN